MRRMLAALLAALLAAVAIRPAMAIETPEYRVLVVTAPTSCVNIRPT